MKYLFLILFLLSSLFSSIVVMETTQGNIKIQLEDKNAPLAIENFTTLIKQGFYDGIIFHRIIKNFMIQSGDPTGTGRGGNSIWNKSFKDENFNAKFDRAGILAMANRGANTNGSQFFITTIPTPWLNRKHTIFGYVMDEQSMVVVKKLENVETSRRGMPQEKQEILKAYILKN